MFICEKLGFRTLREMNASLTEGEYLLWVMFYARKHQLMELQRNG